MGKTSHHQLAREKEAMELSPERAEHFRSQITRATWRYAAQGPLDAKVKGQVYRLGSASQPSAPKGVGISVKVALLMIVATVGGTAAWRVLEVRLASLREDGSSRRARARSPVDAPGPQGVLHNGDLPPPIVPSEFGPGTSPEEGSAQAAVEEAREPWANALAAGGQPPPFEEVCFDDFPPEQRGVRPQELRRWLTTLDGRTPRMNYDSKSATLVEGSVKLRSPWPAGAALRLAVSPRELFRIHVFGGDAAVTLEYGSQPRPSWTAYVSAANPRRPHPERAAYVGRDNDRHSRTGWGPIALHYDDGQLVMTRGNICLLAAPLPQQPSEVYCEGSATWRGIALFRSGPPPADEERRRVVLRADKPAKLTWRHNLPRGADFEKTDEGPVRLVSRRAANDAGATFALPEPGLHEIILQIGEATPGTGLFLGDAEGRPVGRVGLLREPRSGQLMAEFSPPGERRDQANLGTSQAIPLVRPGQWFRLVLGVGTFKCWTSADGRHWAQLPQQPPRGTPLGLGTIGLYCLAGEPERAIALRHLEIRELSALTSLASAEARKGAVASDGPELSAWLQAVARQQPPRIDADDWRRACALRTLAGAPARELGALLLERLVREAVVETGVAAQEAAVEKRLAILQEAALLWDGGDPDATERLLRCYDLFGQSLLRESSPRPSATLTTALASSELWSPVAVDILRGPCARSDLLSQVVQGNWSAVQEVRGQIDYWRRPWDVTRLGSFAGQEEWKQWSAWSGYLASRAPKASTAKAAPQPLPDETETARERRGWRGPRRVLTPEEQREIAQRKAWQPPLIEQISKDGFSLIAEFEASLQGEAYDDACQTAMTADPQAALGLLPWAKDPQLSLTFPTAVALAMQTHPGMRQTMLDKFAAPGLVRVRQAKLAGDVASLGAATVHLPGTQAASEAHHYLGDRALAAGDSQAALAHYQRALADAPADARKQIAAVSRLAGALSGRAVGEKPTESIDFGGTRLSPDEFEQVVADHLAQRRPGGGTSSAPAAVKTDAWMPSRFESRPWGPEISARNSRLATACDGETLYVASQFELHAVKLSDGTAKWRPNGAPGGAAAQGGVACRPALGGGRVYVRRCVGGEAWSIVCVDATSGQTVWGVGPQFVAPGERLICDPLLVGDQVYALTTVRQNDGTLDVRLVVYDAAKGEPLRQHVVLHLADLWNGLVPCAATTVDDHVVAAVGGCVLCCDLAGNLLWVRKQTRVPEGFNVTREAMPARHPEPPLVAGDRLYVTQRDAREVDCLDPRTGRLHWRYVAADLGGIIGASEQSAVVEVADGLVGLDAATGQPRWHREIDHLLEATLGGASAGGAEQLVHAKIEPTTTNAWRTYLGWIDLRSGREAAATALPDLNLAGAKPEIGPFIRWGNRAWLVAGRGNDDKRRLWELLPRGKSLAAASDEVAVSSWLPEAPVGAATVLRADVSAALGWTLLSSQSDRLTGWQPKWQNESDVVTTLTDAARPTRMLRLLKVPAAGACKLVLQVGHDGAERWELELAAADKSIFRSEISPKTSAGGWLRREIDLSTFAGQTIWLSATARALDGRAAHPVFAKLAIAAP